MTTSKDVARIAGVSQATVSRVLSGSSLVTPETRQRVLDAMRTVEYEPNAAARTMKTRSTDTVGVIVGDLTNPFVPQTINSLGSALSRHDRNMIVWTSDDRGADAARRAFRQGIVDGLVLAGTTELSAQTLETLAAQLPLVAVNQSFPGVACDQAVTDNIEGGRLVARYLLQHGHRRVAVIGANEQSNVSSRDRVTGFVGHLRRQGLALDPDLVFGGAIGHNLGREGMRALMALDSRPTAVFCTNDVIALGAIDAARELGLAVPDDVWVIGFGGTDLGAWESYSLTSVHQPQDRIAQAGIAMLLERIAEPGRPTRVRQFAGKLIVRRSTAGRPLDLHREIANT